MTAAGASGPAPGPSQPSGDAQRIGAAVCTSPDVAGLWEGAAGGPGVRTDEHTVEVQIVAHYGRPLPEIGDDLAARLAPELAGRSLQVVIADLLLPGEEFAPETSEGPEATGAAG